jgi:carboxyl-terminal processing protease
MPKISKIVLLAVSVALVIAVFLGVNSSSVSAAANEGDGAYRQINVYSEVLHHIQTEYVTDPNIKSVTNGALHGLLESLDADSSYLSPEDYKVYSSTHGQADRSRVAQVGIVASKRFGYANVVSVIPGSPADKAGLNDGDILEAIETKDTREIPLAMIQRMLEGEPGSTLTVAVVRPGKAEPDKLTMTRAIVAEPPVKDELYENATILYVKPEILDREHLQQLEAKLKAMPKAGNKKILLDLRDVSAGDMTEGTRLANDLMKDGTIASLEGQKVPKQVFTAEPNKAINASAPLVVLVNRGTAGPAELVAAALLDNKRAEVVGEHTFELPDGSAIILSIAKYSSPSGKKLQDEGVTPNVQVASGIEDQTGVDEDEPAQAATPATPKKPQVQVDEQLTKALEILKAKAA